ncbi:MAG: phosphate acyltransferase PlsX [Lachnospiraceae bacterium]|jgi:glycerol-3-phosphate acyltransferase PlsX|nr:phosphate acyltransferase PlsX [Lachnospiraceae bacterium]MCI1397486.1 phosphate acyltransferase PlsX [Lachnospiraceae bacterium]MCI1423266.1 phosphate acyltransferase PlsX [Lachnospiraceae bacterium]MCI1452059.1 phosphate acyltransferase PlsX [Lachnospiraceae bacterium]MDD5848343.1 phosphate acyltransferase PlsX [Bacillota bacterium]
MSELVRVAVDAMGGDNAPGEILRGAVDALKANADLDLTLVGKEEVIRAELAKYEGVPEDRCHVLNATEVIEMAEPPVAAITKKRDSSIVKGMKLVHDGTCDAFFTAGSSGATLVGGQIIVGRIKGIERPPFAPVMPTQKGPCLLLDCGANVDPKPSMLVQFAQMGSIYMERIIGVKNPRVALYNIGAEEDKGNALAKETYPLLKALPDINFIGNIESRDIPFGAADVVVCDAFTGNAILKMYEGTAKMLLGEVKGAIMRTTVSKIGGLLIKNSLKSTMQKFNIKTYGGAPLLGLTGLVVKAHGNAKAIEVQHALEQCIQWKHEDINGAFKARMHLVDRTKTKQDAQ